MTAHEHPWAFVLFVEVLHADSALEVVSNVLGYHALAGYKKMSKKYSFSKANKHQRQAGSISLDCEG